MFDMSIKRLKGLLCSGTSLCAAYSGGKDSTCVLILMLEAIRQCIQEGHSVPKCYVTNADTRREMPSMHQYLIGAVTSLEVYIATHKLPVEVIMVQPPLTARFTWVTIGRGKLPSYEGQTRDCAIGEKVNPQKKAMSHIAKSTGGQYVVLVGSRYEESVVRRKSMDKYQVSDTLVTESSGHKYHAPIANWFLEDVWDLLSGCECKNGVYRHWPTFLVSFSELIELYADANEGVCGVINGDSGNKAGCGSRFGCAWCNVVGARDRSLESLIKSDPSKYSYMEGLVKFRHYLRAIRWDLNKRDYRGRAVSKAGYLKVTPDYWKPETKRDILRFLITLDVLEQERAQSFSDRYYKGDIEQSADNLLLTEPMFQFVTWDDLLAIDFTWSLGRDFDFAGAAAKEWIDIYDHGVRYLLPEVSDLAVVDRQSIPKHRWFDVSLPVAEVVGLTGLNASGRELEVAIAEEVQVTAGAGEEYIDFVREHYTFLQSVDVAELARLLVHHRWVKMKSSDLIRYDKIAKRNDYLLRHANSNSIHDIHSYLIQNSIDNATHDQLLREHRILELENDEQADIFGVQSILDCELVSKTKKRSSIVTSSVEHIDIYRDSSNQMSMF